jgi:HlyD family secretion protein
VCQIFLRPRVVPASKLVVSSGGRCIAGMSIVPLSDELIIEAHVTQLDRKAVHSGLEAQIHLSAYSSRVVPKIPGAVRTVSGIASSTTQPINPTTSPESPSTDKR